MQALLKKHYYWILAAIIFLEMIVYGGIINSYSIYTVPITEDFGIGRGPLSIADLNYNIFSFISTIAVGMLFPKYGYRKIATASLLISTIALVLMSFAPNLLIYGICRALFGIGHGACFTAGAVKIIRSWFFRHQGLILGLVTMSTGIGGSILAPALTEIIITAGWRNAARFAALLLFLITTLYLLIRDDPQVLGLKQFGIETPVTSANKQKVDDWQGYTGKIIYRKPLFYLTCIATTVSCVCVYTTSQTIVPFFRDAGYTPAEAASFNSLSMISLAIAKLIAGWFADRFGGKPLVIICLASTVLGQSLLLNPTITVNAHLGISIFSAGICLTSIAVPLLTQSLFGYSGSTQVNSIVLSLPALAATVALPLNNFARDRLGSYLPALRLAVIIDIALFALYLVMFAISRKDKQTHTKANCK